MSKPLLVVVLFVAGALAGCIGASGAGAKASEGPAVQNGPAQFDETTGGVDGLVTDTEISPVVGAVVGILKDDSLPEPLTIATDATGHFSFSHVPPGEHTIAASALGYSSDSRRVKVEAGSAVNVQFALEKLASEEAYQVTLIKKGTVSAEMYRVTPGQCYYFSSYIPTTGTTVDQYRTLVKSCGGSGGATWADGSPGQLHFIKEFLRNTSQPWRTQVAELAWQPQTAVTGKGFLMDLNAPNITRGYGGSVDQAEKHTWYKMQGKSPIIIRVDNPTTLEERGIPESDWYSYPEGKGCTAPGNGNPNCDWFIRLFGAYCDISSNLGDCYASPVDFGLPQSQQVTLYYSYFYKDPAPAEFTALPDR